MIGVFDSGIGGLSVLAAIARSQPQAELIYLADTAHVPYGNKSDDAIRQRVLAIGSHLRAAGCTTLVAACNTATAAAVQALRQSQPEITVVGIEPGVKPAASSSRSGSIAVLATESTARSARLQQLIAHHASPLGVAVRIVPCPGWATHVETLQLDDSALAAEVTATLAPLLDEGVDRIVLGCTHYTFLLPLLQPLVAGRAELVEVADAVAREVARRSLPTTTASPSPPPGRIHLQATARAQRLEAALEALGLSELQPRLAGPAQLVQV
ncbi:MAG: glutamate racemase [Sterolibacterium sp.]|nr:glutamate racemase [Sterolibacterium sp.]